VILSQPQHAGPMVEAALTLDISSSD